jgi:hypothetical protein
MRKQADERSQKAEEELKHMSELLQKEKDARMEAEMQLGAKKSSQSSIAPPSTSVTEVNDNHSESFQVDHAAGMLLKQLRCEAEKYSSISAWNELGEACAKFQALSGHKDDTCANEDSTEQLQTNTVGSKEAKSMDTELSRRLLAEAQAQLLAVVRSMEEEEKGKDEEDKEEDKEEDEEGAREVGAVGVAGGAEGGDGGAAGEAAKAGAGADAGVNPVVESESTAPTMATTSAELQSPVKQMATKRQVTRRDRLERLVRLKEDCVAFCKRQAEELECGSEGGQQAQLVVQQQAHQRGQQQEQQMGEEALRVEVQEMTKRWCKSEQLLAETLSLLQNADQRSHQLALARCGEGRVVAMVTTASSPRHPSAPSVSGMDGSIAGMDGSIAGMDGGIAGMDGSIAGMVDGSIAGMDGSGIDSGGMEEERRNVSGGMQEDVAEMSMLYVQQRTLILKEAAENATQQYYDAERRLAVQVGARVHACMKCELMQSRAHESIHPSIHPLTDSLAHCRR